MPITRRIFVQSLAVGAAALHQTARGQVPSATSKGALAPGAEAARLILSAPLTHSDWMLKKNGPKWGPEGVRHMLDACKECGWSQVYWRVFDAGVATYKSKLLRPGDKAETDNYFHPQNEADLAIRQKFSPLAAERAADILKQLEAMDYAAFDSLTAAIEYGHTIGLKIHAWATINEDDHGWGWSSDYSKAHPQHRWVRRNGNAYRSQLSFAFPEVRAYKLSLIDELLTNYDVDGLFLDWIRTGDVRDNPQTDATGVADSGYEAPNIVAFKKKYGADPHDVPNDDDRWVRVRAEPQTLFMRSVRERVNKHRKRLPIAVMVGHLWHYRGMQDPIDGNLRGLLIDVAAWAEEGLMDAAIAAGYYRAGGNATKAFEALRDETKGKVDLWYYAWVPQTPEEFGREFETARGLAAKRMLFWEADYIDDRPQAAALKKAMSARAK
jgi:glycosyl hydrolase family 10